MEGLDTLADGWLNGNKLLEADNMHRCWEVETKGLLRLKDNSLLIVFHSPTRYIADAYRADPDYGGASDALNGFVYLRKAHYMLGWDWGARLPDCGIWRDVSLLGVCKGRIGNVLVRQRHQDGKVELSIKATLTDVTTENIHVEASLITPQGEALPVGDSVLLDNPELWWPNGYGAQPLYTVNVALLDADGHTLDQWRRNIGLRTMTVQNQKDEWGQSFCYEVNGVSIFAMGADYIPEDNLLSRVTPERTRALLESAKLANFNTVRVWGGGYYPSDSFYDDCDELGLLVWQDFMFACGEYKLTPEFERTICAEIRDNVLRLRHHPSLGLWCGNNENEMFEATGRGLNTYTKKYEYIRLFEDIIPQIVHTYSPDTFYWPSSPSSGGKFDCPNDESRGDVHYWDVWHGGKPFTAYRNFLFRFVSEFGFQAYPHPKTLEAVTSVQERDPFSYEMEKHQRNGQANGKILMSVAQMYPYPKDLNSLCYTSQILQADAMRYGVEHWRRNRGRCMGAIYWQLNDCWPVISWSSIDYFGRWKALHYAAKRFFAPLLLSCKEEGELTQMQSVNDQLAQPVENRFQLCISNETMEEKECTVCWSLRDASSNRLMEEQTKLTVSPLCSQWLPEKKLPDMDRRRQYIAYQLQVDHQIVSQGSVIMTRPKHFLFLDPKLTAAVSND
ncbi:MAG: glycoside hydrolase family 2 protein, partial [Eubacteriales bacterium]|nr:glycoside hydrolase family 2 protein [Eubacteriales bacterium]